MGYVHQVLHAKKLVDQLVGWLVGLKTKKVALGFIPQQIRKRYPFPDNCMGIPHTPLSEQRNSFRTMQGEAPSSKNVKLPNIIPKEKNAIKKLGETGREGTNRLEVNSKSSEILGNTLPLSPKSQITQDKPLGGSILNYTR